MSRALLCVVSLRGNATAGAAARRRVVVCFKAWCGRGDALAALLSRFDAGRGREVSADGGECACSLTAEADTNCGARADPKWFRPPSGKLTKEMSDILNGSGYKVQRLAPPHSVLAHAYSVANAGRKAGLCGWMRCAARAKTRPFGSHSRHIEKAMKTERSACSRPQVAMTDCYSLDPQVTDPAWICEHMARSVLPWSLVATLVVP
jgi:hypothetical protein